MRLQTSPKWPITPIKWMEIGKAGGESFVGPTPLGNRAHTSWDGIRDREGFLPFLSPPFPFDFLHLWVLPQSSFPHNNKIR